jgi:AraC-like DNA-binding protein
MVLRKAERYIREHFVENPPLHDVASVAGLSPAYFSTVFKEELGESFSDFINGPKVDKAAELLVGSELSLADVADTCGFQDQSWFSRVFKRHMGVSPGRFRESGGRRSPELQEIHS